MSALGKAGRRLVLKAQFAARGAREAVDGAIKARRPTVPLEQVQRRLELLLTAMYGRPIPITSVEAKAPNWVERVAAFVSRDPRAREAMPSVDGAAIHLPSVLNARDGVEAAVARYRLLAVEQAERLTRGTARRAPLKDALERDLFLVREGAAVDARIASAMPGMARSLDHERQAALTRRPSLDKLTTREREVELLLRDALVARPEEHTAASSDPAASIAWAQETAAKIRQGQGSYRGLPPASLWGTVTFGGDMLDESKNLPDETPPPPAGINPPASSTGWHKSHSHDAQAGIADDQSGDSAGRVSHSDAPAGDDEANALSDDPSDDISGDPWDTPDAPRAFSGNAGTDLGDPTLQVLDGDPLQVLPPGILYDEWDSEAGKYITRATTVRLYESADGDDRWATDMLQQHAALVRQVRQQFERLRARRTLLGRQRAGDDLDIAACVDAIVDRRIGQVPDDRLYMDARPARRGVAISLLVDVSGSTENRVSDELRIVDIEKIALLLAGEALDALGDLYAIYAFAGKSAFNVKVTTIKNFGERSGDVVKRRISALEPGGFTRLGAAVRHATLELARQTAGHRLLLILSDGRPNDVDRYQGPYGVEDSRQAIMEARASGIFPYCLTVDRDASEYLPRIFGTAGHTILQRPAQLPTALLKVVRALIRKP